MTTTVRSTITLTPGTHVLRFELLSGRMGVQPIVIANAAVGETLGEGTTCDAAFRETVRIFVRTGEGTRVTEDGTQEWFSPPPFGSTYSDKTEQGSTVGADLSSNIAFNKRTGEGTTVSDQYDYSVFIPRLSDGVTVTDQYASGVTRTALLESGTTVTDDYASGVIRSPEFGEYHDLVTVTDTYDASASLVVRIEEGSIVGDAIDAGGGQGAPCSLVVTAHTRHRKNQLIDCSVAITNLTARTVIIRDIQPVLVPLDSGWGYVGVVSDPLPTDYAFYRVTYKLRAGSTVVYRWSAIALEAGTYEVGVTVVYSDGSTQYGSTTIDVQGYQ